MKLHILIIYLYIINIKLKYMKSNLIIIVEALELGIPIEYNSRLYKLFETDKSFELKYAIVRSQKEEIEWCYMGNIPFSFVFEMAKNLTEGDRLNLIHLLVQVNSKIEKDMKKENLTFNHEDEFFKKLEVVTLKYSK